MLFPFGLIASLLAPLQLLAMGVTHYASPFLQKGCVRTFLTLTEVRAQLSKYKPFYIIAERPELDKPKRI